MADGKAQGASQGTADGGRYVLAERAKELPEQADTMLADVYLRDCPDSSARLFRVYKPVPAHFHRSCDEYLYVVSGRGTFWMGDASEAAECRPGQLICFAREVVHAIPEIIEAPLVFMAIDAPRRAPDDVHFIEKGTGSAGTFMARNA